MATSVAAIASASFDNAGDDLADAVKACTLSHEEQGEYDPGTGSYSTVTTTTTGRAIFDTTTVVEDLFAGYVAGPADLLVWLEGLDFAPQENDGVEIDGTDHTVKAIGDVVGAAALFGCMVVQS